MNKELIFTVKYATEDDYPYIRKMIEYSSKNQEGEVGYPRCLSAEELFSEIEMYENRIEESICILYCHDTPVALGGFIYEPEDEAAYVMGPICEKKFYNKENLKAMIEQMLASKQNLFKKLTVAVSRRNTLLDETYQELGWIYKETQREMGFDIKDVNIPSVQYQIHEISDKENKNIEPVFQLLDEVFHWNGTKYSIDDLLDEGFKLGYVCDEAGHVAGAVNWAYLENVDFSRLEYVAVREESRGKGIGEAMISHVLKDSIQNGMKQVYLSTNIENDNALNLYRKLGFYDTVSSNIYMKNLVVF